MAEGSGYRAKVRYLMISPFKVRRIASNISKMPYSEAVAVLETMPHEAARLLRKVISSAAANALFQNKKLDEDMLYVKLLTINEGPRMKRLWPRARGRADQLLKRMSHIEVVLDEIANLGDNGGTES